MACQNLPLMFFQSFFRDGFDGVPMLRDLALQRGRGRRRRRAPPNSPSLITRTKLLSPRTLWTLGVLHRDPGLRHRFQGLAQPGQPVRDLGVVLDVVVAVEIPGQPVQLPVHQDVVHEPADQLLVRRRLVAVLHIHWPVGHGVLAEVWPFRGVLQVVPMLHDLAVLEPEHVEPDLRPEEVVLGVGEHEVPVLEHEPSSLWPSPSATTSGRRRTPRSRHPPPSCAGCTSSG